MEGSNSKDHRLLFEKLKKRKAMEANGVPLFARAQTESVKGLSLDIVLQILLMFYHWLDVPRLKRVPYPSTLKSSLLVNLEYEC